MDRDEKVRAGVLNTGENNMFVNCEMSGPDAGMIDKGKNTKVIESKITAHGNNFPKGVFLRVGGDMRNDGQILTDNDATVDIVVKGNYVSDKGKIVQADSKNHQKKWCEKPFGIIFLGVITALIAAYLQWQWGWNGIPGK